MATKKKKESKKAENTENLAEESQVKENTNEETSKEPTPEELSEKMDMPEEKIRKVLKIAKEPISTETPIGDEDDTTLGDFIEDPLQDSPIDAATENNLHDATDGVLSSLTAREAKVLRMRFGIGMNTDHTLEEVGKQFDCLLYTSPSPRDATLSRMPSSA